MRRARPIFPVLVTLIVAVGGCNQPGAGERWDGHGTNVAVHATTDVTVCLFDELGTETQVATTRTGTIRHCYLPGVGPGQRYGFRTAAAPRLLLTDPYARRLDGGLRWDPDVFAHQDTAAHVPRSVVVEPAHGWDRRPRYDHADRVFYELHVKGFTQQLEEVPAELRGTYAGLAHPAAIAKLTGLGITTVELLPVHHFVDEPHLQRAGLTNYWGYNSLGWFAPHRARRRRRAGRGVPNHGAGAARRRDRGCSSTSSTTTPPRASRTRRRSAGAASTRATTGSRT